MNPLCLQWRYRGLRLIEEILRFECDLIALEECDQAEWMYNVYLEKCGYKMIFQEKSDSPCLNTTSNYTNPKNNIEYSIESNRFKDTIKSQKIREKWTMKKDGCCIFYKENVFKLVKNNYVISVFGDDMKHDGDHDTNKNNSNNSNNYNDNIKNFTTSQEIYEWINNVDNDKLSCLNIQCSAKVDLIDPTKRIVDKTGNLLGYGKLTIIDSKKSKKLGKTVFKVPATTFIALNMLHISSNEEFIVIVTHLKSTKDGKGEQMRVGQLEAMLGFGPYREVIGNKALSAAPIIRNPKNLPVLFCCDLNAKAQNTMKFDKNLGKMVKSYGFECYQRVTDKVNGLGFESMYKRVFKGHEPLYTTWKERRSEDTFNRPNSGQISKHTIDFIFSNGNAWDITHYLDIPNVKNTIGGKALLPDWHYPSDHFSLALRLQWQDASNTSKQ